MEYGYANADSQTQAVARFTVKLQKICGDVLKGKTHRENPIAGLTAL